VGKRRSVDAHEQVGGGAESKAQKSSDRGKKLLFRLVSRIKQEKKGGGNSSGVKKASVGGKGVEGADRYFPRIRGGGAKKTEIDHPSVEKNRGRPL